MNNKQSTWEAYLVLIHEGKLKEGGVLKDLPCLELKEVINGLPFAGDKTAVLTSG